VTAGRPAVPQRRGIAVGNAHTHARTRHDSSRAAQVPGACRKANSVRPRPQTTRSARSPTRWPRLRARVRAEFAHRILDVALDRFGRQNQTLADVATVTAGCRKRHDLAFAFGERQPPIQCRLERSPISLASPDPLLVGRDEQRQVAPRQHIGDRPNSTGNGSRSGMYNWYRPSAAPPAKNPAHCSLSLERSSRGVKSSIVCHATASGAMLNS